MDRVHLYRPIAPPRSVEVFPGCLRSLEGHTAAVNAVCFAQPQPRPLSAEKGGEAAHAGLMVEDVEIKVWVALTLTRIVGVRFVQHRKTQRVKDSSHFPWDPEGAFLQEGLM